MLVKVLNFGSNWWSRFGRDPRDRYRFTRHAAWFNSTGVRCGGKVRRHWVVPGLVRFNGVSGFNAHRPSRSIGHTFCCSDCAFAFGGNRLLFEKRSDGPAAPDCYLVVVSSEQHGRIDFRSESWKSDGTQVIAASQLREMQESMLLMSAGDWVRTGCGIWRLSAPIKGDFQAALELLEGGTLHAGCGNDH